MTLVRIAIFKSDPSGVDIPAKGQLWWAPSKRLHVEDPTDHIVLPAPFKVVLGADFLDEDGAVVTAGEPGIAWAEVDPTDVPNWAWTVVERTNKGRGTTWVEVPDQPLVEYADLVELDPETMDPEEPLSPAWVADLAAHAADTTAVHGIANTANLLTTSTGAGGVLSGSYPNPGFAVNMVEQSELDASTADLVDSGGPTTLALDGRFVQPLQIQPPKASDVTVTDESTNPRPTESFDGYFWATGSAGQIYRSTDGATWTTVSTTCPVRLTRFLKAQDGELIGHNGLRAYRSSGWATNPATATWAIVANAPNGSCQFMPFGFDGDGNKFILTEYSSTRADSRYVQISLDGGLTWTNKWDTNAQYPATFAESHLHAACYDPWEDRFWFTEGHGAPKGLYYSDNDGTSWTRLTGGLANTVEPTPTVMVATDDGIVCGTDAAPFSVYSIKRTDDPADMQLHGLLRWQISADGTVGFGEVGWRDPTTGIVYISYMHDSLAANGFPIVTAATASIAGEVWTAPDGGNASRVWWAGVLDNTFLAHTATAANATQRTAIGTIGYPTVPIPNVMDTGNIGGGATGDKNTSLAAGSGATTNGFQHGVAVGVQAKASSTTNGKGTAVGYAANAQADSTTAVGYLATATGSTAVVIGANATATTFSETTVVGASASATASGAVALGRNSTAGTAGTAVGRTANASATNAISIGLNSVAGSSSVVVGTTATTTTLANCVAIGFAATVTGGGSGIAIGHSAAAVATSVAIGASAVIGASQTLSVAIGHQASAQHTRSVALGSTVTTTANDQVRVATRHIEYSEIAADAAAPATDAVRIYAKDNGSGKTGLYARFATGAVQQIALEP